MCGETIACESLNIQTYKDLVMCECAELDEIDVCCTDVCWFSTVFGNFL